MLLHLEERDTVGGQGTHSLNVSELCVDLRHADQLLPFSDQQRHYCLLVGCVCFVTNQSKALCKKQGPTWEFVILPVDDFLAQFEVVGHRK